MQRYSVNQQLIETILCSSRNNENGFARLSGVFGDAKEVDGGEN